MMRRPLAMSALVLLLSGCSGPCRNQVVEIATSPEGAHDAVLFQRDCGATTGFSTQISVVPHGEAPIEAGNAFIADTDHGKAAAARWGGPWAKMNWAGSDRLVVRHDPHARIFKQASMMRVRITYRPSATGGVER